MPIPERTAANNRNLFFNVLSAQPAVYRIAEYLGTRNHAGELRIRMRRQALPAEQVDMARQLPSGQNEPIEMFALLCLCSTIPEMTLLRIALHAKIGRNPSTNMLMHNIREAQLSVILDDCKILHERLMDYCDYHIVWGYEKLRFHALTEELRSQIQQIAPERFGELSEHLNQLTQKNCWRYAKIILESTAGLLLYVAITGGFIWAIVEIAKRLEFDELHFLFVYLPLSLCALCCSCGTGGSIRFGLESILNWNNIYSLVERLTNKLDKLTKLEVDQSSIEPVAPPPSPAAAVTSGDDVELAEIVLDGGRQSADSLRRVDAGTSSRVVFAR